MPRSCRSPRHASSSPPRRPEASDSATRSGVRPSVLPDHASGPILGRMTKSRPILFAYDGSEQAKQGADLARATGFEADAITDQGNPIWERIVHAAEEHDDDHG